MQKSPGLGSRGFLEVVETDGIEPPYLSRPKAIQRTSVPACETRNRSRLHHQLNAS